MVHPCIGHAESVVASRVPYLPEQVGTGVTNVTRSLQSGAAGSRAALRGFRAALLAALRCHPGSPAWQRCCQQGSPAPIHGSPALPSWQPCAAILAALRCHPGSPARQQRCHPAALRGSPARQPWWQQGCHAGSPARHRQPCAAAPGVAYFARFGAGRVPRPFTLRTLKTAKHTRGCEGPEQVLRCRHRHPDEGSVPSGCGDPARVRDSAVTLHTQGLLLDARDRSTSDYCHRMKRRCQRAARKARQPCADAGQPCAAAGLPAGQQRCHAGSPALPSWQPCTGGLAALLAALRGSRAAAKAALRCQLGSPAGLQGCPAGSPAAAPL